MACLYSGTKENRNHIFGHCMFAREHLPYNSSWLQYLLQISSMQGFCFQGFLDIWKSSMADLVFSGTFNSLYHKNKMLRNIECSKKKICSIEIHRLLDGLATQVCAQLLLIVQYIMFPLIWEKLSLFTWREGEMLLLSLSDVLVVFFQKYTRYFQKRKEKTTMPRWKIRKHH